MDEITFLDKDYERKINFLNEQYTRLWTKFNIFFTIESSLLILSLTKLDFISLSKTQIHQLLS
jgi:hypothetical protein